MIHRKSHQQKIREELNSPIYSNPNIDYQDKVRCPKCRKWMTKHNFEKYGRCYQCYMNEKIKLTEVREV